jgi:hypothetical protein
MRCTKLALLIFGAGLLLGLVVVVAEIEALARGASLLMALGIVALPSAALIDWWRAATPLSPPRAQRKPTKRPAVDGARGGPGSRRRAPRKR